MIRGRLGLGSLAVRILMRLEPDGVGFRSKKQRRNGLATQEFYTLLHRWNCAKTAPAFFAGEVVLAASRKSKRFWVWLSVGVVLIVAIAGVALARLVKGSSIDPRSEERR